MTGVFSFNCPCGIDQNNPDQPIYTKDEEITIKSGSRVGSKSKDIMDRVIGMLVKPSHNLFSVQITQHLILPPHKRYKRSSKGSDYIASVF